MPAVIGAGHLGRSRVRLLARCVIACLAACAPWPAIATTVTSVSWDHRPLNLTEIIIDCDGPVAQGSYRAFTIPDPPRIVIVIEGASTDASSETLNIADGTVDEVRLGAHPERSPTEVHIVLDVSSDRVRLRELTADGPRLVALVGRPRQAPLTPTPTATLAGPVTAPDGPPPSGPVPPSTANPTPTPIPSRAPASGSLPTSEDLPVRPEVRRYDTVPAAVGTATAEGATPVPPAASEIIDIEATERSDGSTLLLITADGRLPMGCARVLNVSGEPPRLIVSIRAVSAPDLPRTIDIGDANIDRIRLVHSAETTAGELHLVLQLARSEVDVVDRRQVGENLVLQLAARALDAAGP
jgi:hypothetical protein